MQTYSALHLHLLSLSQMSPSEQMVEEAGGVVTRMDGGKFTVFDRSVLVSNGIVHEKVVLLQASHVNAWLYEVPRKSSINHLVFSEYVMDRT